MELVTLIGFWALLCWGVAALATSRGRSSFGFFLLSFFFSPLLGLIVVLVMSNLTLEATRAEDQRRSEERREEDRKREHEKQLESLRAVAALPARTSDAAHVDSSSVRSVADELLKLAELRDKGVITPAEFEQQKRVLLSPPNAA